MHVTIYDSQQALELDHERVERLVKAFLNWKKISPQEVILHFVDKNRICTMHAKYFSDPSPTDCITFPIDSPTAKPCIVLGEVFICPQVAIETAEKLQEDPYRECALYIVHGLLHLLGHEDETEAGQKTMRLEESAALDHLSKEDSLLQE